MPAYELAVDWNNDGDFSDVEDDISADMQRVEFRRGRDYASQLTGKTVSGMLRARLNNLDGKYSSFNAASPIFGDAKPGRPVRFRAGTGASADTTLWQGHLLRLIPMPSRRGNYAILEAVGPLGFVNRREVRIAMSTSLATGTAIGDILDSIAWPAGLRTIDAGQTTMERFWINQQKTISALRKVEDTESGFLSESKDGKIVFEDRHHRLITPHTVSQATFSDLISLGYTAITQLDPLLGIYNIFEVSVRHYSIGGLAVLWTLSEVNTDSPSIETGATKTFFSSFPNPDSDPEAWSVDAWTTPIATTDFTANSLADGSGVDLTGDISVVVVKFAEAMRISLTNAGAGTAFITFLQARGTPVLADDPVRIQSEDAASQADYGENTYPSPAEFVPDTEEAQDWCDFNLSIYKDPIPILKFTLLANASAAHLAQILARDISDRITIAATGKADLGIDEDFFIESERHTITSGFRHQVTYECSPATAFGGFCVIGTSELGISTRLAY